MKGAKRKTSVSENKPLFNTKNAFFYSQFWNENGQNVKCACSFIPHTYSGMDRTPFHPFCSQGQNAQNVANTFCTNHAHSRIVNKNRALSNRCNDANLKLN